MFAVVAALSALTLVPAMAGAEKFAGQSQQGKQVRMSTKPNGEVREFSIRWHTRACDNGGSMDTRWTSFVHPLVESRPGTFADQGAFTTRYSDARVRFVTSVSGELASPNRWHGRFKIKAHIEFEAGGSNDCRLGPISWSARR